MQIIIKTIDHKKQPYNTCGDWRWENKKGKPINQTEALARADTDDCVLRINISNLKSWRYEMLVAIHELTETLICLNDGVLVEDVDAFDKAFEAAREEGNEDEPGDDPTAPYVEQHCVATAVERLLCASLGCDWRTYEEKVGELPTIKTKG